MSAQRVRQHDIAVTKSAYLFFAFFMDDKHYSLVVVVVAWIPSVKGK